MKVKRIALALIISLIMIATTGCSSKLYENSKDGFTQVTNVQGASFEVSSSWSQSATAIFTINEDDTYDGLYVKKTDDSYLLFDMQNILIAVGKTNFDFKDNETVETLEAHDINNVWLSTDEKKLDYESGTKDGVYKIIANAKADYSVTPTQYATFMGYVSSVKSGDTEYSMFVGAMTTSSSLTKTQEELCSHVAKSFKLTGETVSEDSTEENTQETVEDESLQNEEAEEPTEVEATAIEEPAEETSEEISEEPEDTTESTEEKTDEVIEEETDETEEIVVESDDETEESDSDESTESAEVIEETEEPVEVEQPQAETDTAATTFSVSTAKESSTYKPLSIGEAGSFFLFEGTTSMAAVRTDAIYTGTEAERLVLTYGGRKTTPSVGTEFVVLEYSSTVDPREVYIDCKFLGADGENLNYLGVAYPSKCYDMYENIEVKDGIYTQIYLYYEVPVGTREYLLKFGSNVGEKSLGTGDSITANYIVDTGYRAKTSRDQIDENRNK